ncbi:MAG: 50S ribosomal protein L24 [Candidatus Saccharibacteria bacterium]|nr:50S ribosomal protein L24 [Candidatus Saccharibacteria bacterium]
MANRILQGDLVKIIAGDNKGKIAKVIKINAKKGLVILEGIGNRTRHMKKSMYNPMGGKREIQVGISLSNVALVIDEKASKTSRVGYKLDGDNKSRVARQNNNKVIAAQTTKTEVKETKAKKGAKK